MKYSREEEVRDMPPSAQQRQAQLALAGYTFHREAGEASEVWLWDAPADTVAAPFPRHRWYLLESAITEAWDWAQHHDEKIGPRDLPQR